MPVGGELAGMKDARIHETRDVGHDGEMTDNKRSMMLMGTEKSKSVDATQSEQ